MTVSRDSAGDLRLASFRLRPAGIRLLHRVWPGSLAQSAVQSRISTDVIRLNPRASKYGDSQEGDSPSPEGRNDGGGTDTLSPEWKLRFFPSVSGVDPMIPTGHQFVTVAQDHRIAFTDRGGNALPSKSGESTNLSATNFFEGFIQEKNPDGSRNDDNINLYSPQQISDIEISRGSQSMAIISS